MQKCCYVNSVKLKGFTMYVLRNFGVKLPHSTRGQSLRGIRVSKDSLNPGDLVFFCTYRGGRITHVGLYIGENCFIHAASRGVCINILDQVYYKKRYAIAVRLIQ